MGFLNVSFGTMDFVDDDDDIYLSSFFIKICLFEVRGERERE